MPKLYRSIIAEDGRPRVGTERNMLGARVPPAEPARTAREQPEIWLVQLACLMARGEGHSSEAEDLREKLAPAEMRMAVREAAFSRNLSSDLYMHGRRRDL